MLAVLLNWIYVFLICYPIGFVSGSLIKKLTGDKKDIPFSLNVILGIVSVSIITTMLSFFINIGITANIILILLSMGSLFFQRKSYQSQLNKIKIALSQVNILIYFVIAIVFFVVIVKSAQQSRLTDEGYYYMQFIKWIETYPVVPGLGNLEDRFAFNSNWHTVSALFSFSYLFKTPFYDLNGFLVLFCCIYFSNGINNIIKNKSDFVVNILKAFAVIFLFRTQLTASSTDIPSIFFSLLALILIFEKIFLKEFNIYDNNSLIIILLVLYVITVKFSSVFISLFVIYHFILIYNENKSFLIKHGLHSLFIFSILIIPWLVKNIIISGYLIYPVYFIDLFDFDWKIVKETAKLQYYYVEVFAKNISEKKTASEYAELSIIKWLPIWFEKLNLNDRFFFLASIPALIISVFYSFRKKFASVDLKIVLSILLVCIIIWLFKNPAFRFGWQYFYIIIFLAFAFVLDHIYEKNKFIAKAIITFTLSLGLFWISYRTIYEFRYIKENLIIYQAKTRKKASETIIIDNHKFYLSNEPCWDTSIPCLQNYYDRALEMRGDDFSAGFRIKKQK